MIAAALISLAAPGVAPAQTPPPTANVDPACGGAAVLGYLAYLRALGSSGLPQKHGMRREVVMPGREVRLATEGTSFGPGELFEVLRFPCRAQLEAFWDSAAYRDLVKLREGTMMADALLFE